MTNTTKYLYNISPKEFEDLPYKEALEYKKEAARAHVSLLLAEGYMNIKDRHQFNAVYDAVKHNENLLLELKG